MMNKTELLTLAEENVKPKPVPLKEAFWFWMKLGFISFGGPAGQIAIMHQELVENRRWISESRFLHALNFCMVLPGPEAQQLATYIGWLMHRTLGGVIAGLLFILPSLFILIALSWIYIAWGDVAIIAGIFYGIKPAVAAIVLQAAHRIGSRALKHGAHWAIAAAAFVAVFALNVPFPVIVISAAITGFIGGRIAPEKFHSGSGHNKQEKAAVDAAVIDDHTPVPAHALFSWAKLLRIVAAGALLWLIPMTVLTLGLGASGDADGLVLYQGCAPYLRWGLRRPAIRLSGCCRQFWLADCRADDGRAGAGRNHARPADYGGHVCRICGRVYPCRFWRGYAVCRRRRCRLHGDLVYLSPVLHFRAGRRAVYRNDPQQGGFHGTFNRHHSGRSGRHC